jgi:hypothetical protein
MTNQGDEKPSESGGLHIDSDWKAQAQAEKKRLAEEARKQREAAEASGGAAGEAPGAAAGAAQAAAGQQRGRGQMPPANFQTLVSTMITQAMFAMGMIPDPQTGQRLAHLDLARHHIDMLGVLQEKTEGNLDDEEKKLLDSALYELRMNYVQLSQQAIKQQTGEDEEGGGGGPAGGAAPGGLHIPGG